MEIMGSSAGSSANSSPRQRSIEGEWMGFKAVILIGASVSVMFMMFVSVAGRHIYLKLPTKEEITLVLHEALGNNGNGTAPAGYDYDHDNAKNSNYREGDIDITHDMSGLNTYVMRERVPFYMYPRTEAISYHIIQVFYLLSLLICHFHSFVISSVVLHADSGFCSAPFMVNYY